MRALETDIGRDIGFGGMEDRAGLQFAQLGGDRVEFLRCRDLLGFWLLWLFNGSGLHAVKPVAEPALFAIERVGCGGRWSVMPFLGLGRSGGESRETERERRELIEMGHWPPLA